MIKYNKRIDRDGGDYWEVQGHYYSHPVQAAMKLGMIETGDISSLKLQDELTLQSVKTRALRALLALPEEATGSFKSCKSEKVLDKLINYWK